MGQWGRVFASVESDATRDGISSFENVEKLQGLDLGHQLLAKIMTAIAMLICQKVCGESSCHRKILNSQVGERKLEGGGLPCCALPPSSLCITSSNYYPCALHCSLHCALPPSPGLSDIIVSVYTNDNIAHLLG